MMVRVYRLLAFQLDLLCQVDLADKTGEISATFFGGAVDKYYPLLKPEKAGSESGMVL